MSTKRIKPGETLGEPIQSSDMALTTPPNMFDGIFSRPLNSELSPEDRARRLAEEQRASIEYLMAWRVLTHPSNVPTYIARKLLSDAPKARDYYKRVWNWDAVESKLKDETEKLAAWRTKTNAEGVDAQRVLYETYGRNRHNPFTAADRELDSLVKRLARVWVGLEMPRLEDSLYLSF